MHIQTMGNLSPTQSPQSHALEACGIVFMIKFLPIYSLINSGTAKDSSRASETIGNIAMASWHPDNRWSSCQGTQFLLLFRFYSDFISNFILNLSIEAVLLEIAYLIANQVYNFLIFPILFRFYFKLCSYLSNRGYATRDNIFSSESGILPRENESQWLKYLT